MITIKRIKLNYLLNGCECIEDVSNVNEVLKSVKYLGHCFKSQ